MGLFGTQSEGEIFPSVAPPAEFAEWYWGDPNRYTPVRGKTRVSIPPDYFPHPDRSPTPTGNRQPPIAGNGPVKVTGPYSYPGAAKTKTAGTGLAMAAAAALIFFLR